MRVTDTVAWFLDNLQLPLPSRHDLLIAAILDLRNIIASIKKSHPTVLHDGDIVDSTSLIQQLLDVAEMYRHPPTSPVNNDPMTSAPFIADSSAPPTSLAEEQRVLSNTPVSIDHTVNVNHFAAPLSPTQRHIGQQPEDLLPSPIPCNTNAQCDLPNTLSQSHDPLPDNVPFQLPIRRRPTNPAPPTPRITRQQTARQRATAYGALNLSTDGSPLTYSKAKSGPDAERWMQAESEEFDRLIFSQTIRPINLIDQPTDRRRDTTYFNPQTKQKTDTTGNTTYRIRGTAGGDRINYN